MNMHTSDRNDLPDEPPIRRVFRDVIADRLADPRPPQAAMLFQSSVDPFWTDDRFFLGDFYNGILHQDTCQPGTADGVPCWRPWPLMTGCHHSSVSKRSTCCSAWQLSPAATWPSAGPTRRGMQIRRARTEPAGRSGLAHRTCSPGGQRNVRQFGWHSRASPWCSLLPARCLP